MCKSLLCIVVESGSSRKVIVRCGVVQGVLKTDHKRFLFSLEHEQRARVAHNALVKGDPQRPLHGEIESHCRVLRSTFSKFRRVEVNSASRVQTMK